jgi:hypothetical protein
MHFGHSLENLDDRRSKRKQRYGDLCDLPRSEFVMVTLNIHYCAQPPFMDSCLS